LHPALRIFQCTIATFGVTTTQDFDSSSDGTLDRVHDMSSAGESHGKMHQYKRSSLVVSERVLPDEGVDEGPQMIQGFEDNIH